MRYDVGRFRRPMRRSTEGQLMSLISLGDGSTLSLDFTTGVLDPRLTFTRASNATFINSSGLVQWAASNHAPRTNWNFTSPTGSGWNAATTSGTGTFQWVGDGTVIASSGSSGQVFTSITTSTGIAEGLRYVMSVTAQSVTGSPTIQSIFDFTSASGNTYFKNGATATAGTTVASGDRISVSAVATATTMNVRMGCGAWFANRTNESVTLTKFHWHPGSSPVPYYENTATSPRYDSARFDYDPTTLAPRGLLIEGTATNFVTQSNGSTSVWGTGGNRTPTNNTTDLVSPDGTNNATKLVCGSAGAYASFATSISGLTGGATYTISYWIRGPVGHSPRLYAQNGTVGDVTATATTGTYNNTGWTRLTQTYTLPATTTQCLVYFMSTNIVTTGDTFYVYGFQMETGSGASSHIPTGASTVQRLADECQLLDLTTMGFNASAGTIFVDMGARINTGSNRSYTFLPASGGNNQIFEGSGVAFQVFSSGSFVAQIGTSTSAAQKIASAYAVNDYAVSVNGGAVAADTSGALPTSLTKLTLGGSIINTAAYQFGCIRTFKYWPTRLPNAQLQSLTT